MSGGRPAALRGGRRWMGRLRRLLERMGRLEVRRTARRAPRRRGHHAFSPRSVVIASAPPMSVGEHELGLAALLSRRFDDLGSATFLAPANTKTGSRAASASALPRPIPEVPR